MAELTPDRVMQLGLGFWGSKAVLSAVELGLFTLLADGPRDEAAIRKELALHARSSRDFLDTLVAIGLLSRSGDGKYANSPDSDAFLDRRKPSYIGGILEMANARLFKFWGSLTEALKTGKPQNEAKGDADLFEAIYRDPEVLRGFVSAMSGISAGP